MNRLAYYLIVMDGQDHEVRGPYTQATRDQVAKMFMVRSLNCQMFALDIIDGRVIVTEMSVEFLRHNHQERSSANADHTIERLPRFEAG